MSLPVWGSLQKAQDDDETIEQAIARLIQAHDDDADAHLDAGQSLQSHKASAIIDHLALSIVQDKIGDGEVSLQKLLADHRILISAFESLDGWSTSGTIYQDFGNVNIRAGNTINTYALMADVPSNWLGLDWTKDFFWQATVKLAYDTAQQVYFGIGGTEYYGGYSGAGFYIDDGTLYCYHMDIVATAYTYVTQEITGVTITDWNTYRIIYDESEGTLSFYVNGVLKKTWDSGLPTDDSDELAIFQIKTTATAYKYLRVSDLLISVPK